LLRCHCCKALGFEARHLILFLRCPVHVFNGLAYGKACRKPWFLPSNICWFSTSGHSQTLGNSLDSSSGIHEGPDVPWGSHWSLAAKRSPLSPHWEQRRRVPMNSFSFQWSLFIPRRDVAQGSCRRRENIVHLPKFVGNWPRCARSRLQTLPLDSAEIFSSWKNRFSLKFGIGQDPTMENVRSLACVDSSSLANSQFVEYD
jgi:hypothetical protein